jgi:hypothetical protein
MSGSNTKNSRTDPLPSVDMELKALDTVVREATEIVPLTDQLLMATEGTAILPLPTPLVVS